jgi:hypothetical protein
MSRAEIKPERGRAAPAIDSSSQFSDCERGLPCPLGHRGKLADHSAGIAEQYPIERLAAAPKKVDSELLLFPIYPSAGLGSPAKVRKRTLARLRVKSPTA